MQNFKIFNEAKTVDDVNEAAPGTDAEYGKGYSAALVKKLEVVVMAYTKEFLGHAILGTFNKFLKSELHAKDPGGKKGLAMVKKAGIDPNQNWVKIIMFTGPGIGGVIGSRKREERLKTLTKMKIPHDTNESVGVNEARVAPSADLSKPMTRSHAADLKRSLNNSVDGLDALAWKLQYQFEGVDPKAIAQLKALYKDALKIQKAVVSAIGAAK